MQLRFGSTEYLRLIAHNKLRVALDHAAPRGRLKRDVATIKNAQGRDIKLNSGGYVASPVELPLDILNDLIGANFLREADDNPEGRTIYILTDDGVVRGLASPLEPDVKVE